MPKFVQPTPEWIAWADEHPCPQCGGEPCEHTVVLVEEIKMWNWGAPTHIGNVYREEMTCVNGHVTFLDERAKFYDEPVRLY